MKHHAILASLFFWAVGCGGSQPPERLVDVTAELAETEAQELAEFSPSLLREARNQRDAAWEAHQQGDNELAEVHAWIAWLKLRTADNLEAVSQRDGLGHSGAGASAPAGATRQSGGQASSPSGASRGAEGGGRSSNALRAVQDAEDAKLRLLSAGLTPDVRWAEADALLQMAQAALERGEYALAEDLGIRAAFVFEVVRLTRLDDSGGPRLASASVEEVTPEVSAGETETLDETEPQITDTSVPSDTEIPGLGAVPVVVPEGLVSPTVQSEPDTSETPRSRIISNILQPLEN